MRVLYIKVTKRFIRYHKEKSKHNTLVSVKFVGLGGVENKGTYERNRW